MVCAACREREPSAKELEVQLAQAKARQAEAEAEKAEIEACAGQIAVRRKRGTSLRVRITT